MHTGKHRKNDDISNHGIHPKTLFVVPNFPVVTRNFSTVCTSGVARISVWEGKILSYDAQIFLERNHHLSNSNNSELTAEIEDTLWQACYRITLRSSAAQ